MSKFISIKLPDGGDCIVVKESIVAVAVSSEIEDTGDSECALQIMMAFPSGTTSFMAYGTTLKCYDTYEILTAMLNAS